MYFRHRFAIIILAVFSIFTLFSACNNTAKPKSGELLVHGKLAGADNLTMYWDYAGVLEAVPLDQTTCGDGGKFEFNIIIIQALR